MANFKLFYAKLRKFEGGYVNDPDDRGGETYCGITRKNFPNWAGWAIVDKHLPLSKGEIIKGDQLHDLVTAFYKTTFWDVVAGDKVEEQATAERLADFGVTSGQSMSIKQIQRVLGLPETGKITAELMDAINHPEKYLTK